MNIILLILDAVRSDHLSFNGYSSKTSPNLGKIAKESAFFPNTYTPLPNTIPSIISLFTGTYPKKNNRRAMFHGTTNPSVSTLAGILSSRGYKTAFISPKKIAGFGLEKGFGEANLARWKIGSKIRKGLNKFINPLNSTGIAAEYTDRAIGWVKKNLHEKFFLSLVYTDSHWPYMPPQPFDNLFDPQYNGNHNFNDLAKGKINREDMIFGNIRLSEREINHGIAHYDGSIRYIDSQIVRIFDFLKKEGIEQKTLVIIASDHGESLGDHEIYFNHGTNLYEENIKVPLILKNAEFIPEGKIIKERISLIDLVPTIIGILGIPAISCIDGRSLMGLMRGHENKFDSAIFSETVENYWEKNRRSYIPGIKGKWRSIIIGDWKMIYIPHPEKDIFELYNLKEDPKEMENLIESEEDIIPHMKSAMLNLAAEDIDSLSKEEESDKRSREYLKRLGYLG